MGMLLHRHFVDPVETKVEKPKEVKKPERDAEEKPKVTRRPKQS